MKQAQQRTVIAGVLMLATLTLACIAAAEPPKPANEKNPTVAALIFPVEGTLGFHIRAKEIEALGAEADHVQEEIRSRNSNESLVIILKIKGTPGSFPTVHGIAAIKAIRELTKRHRVVAWVHQHAGSAFLIGQLCADVTHVESAEKGVDGIPTPFAQGHWPQPKTREWDAAFEWDMSLLSDGWSGKFRPGYCFNGRPSPDWRMIPVREASSIRADDLTQLARAIGVAVLNETKCKVAEPAAMHYRHVNTAMEEVPVLVSQFGRGCGGDAKVHVAKHIALLQKLLSWSKLCPEVCELNGVPKQEVLEEELARLREVQIKIGSQ